MLEFLFGLLTKHGIPDSVDNAAKNLTDEPTKQIGHTFATILCLIFGRGDYEKNKRDIRYKYALERYDAKQERKHKKKLKKIKNGEGRKSDNPADAEQVIPDAEQPSNLLINADFANPINSRGSSGLVVGKNKYFIDAWMLLAGAVAITDSGLVLDGVICQFFEHEPVIEIQPYVEKTGGEAIAMYNPKTKMFSIRSTGALLTYATTAPNSKPNERDVDMYKSFRYQRRIHILESGYGQLGTIIKKSYPLQPPMRLSPTAVIEMEQSDNLSDIYIWTSDNALFFRATVASNGQWSFERKILLDANL